MSRKHFISAANKIRYSNEPKSVKVAMANLLMELFRENSGTFDRGRFIEACGLVQEDF